MQLPALLERSIERPIKLRLYLTVIASIFACITSVLSHAESPPNIVLILSDDQAWNDYGFMGHEHIETPTLDSLARDGVTFKRGYVPTALCRPSLVTIATGHYAHKHGIPGNDPSKVNYGGKKSQQYKTQRAKLIARIDEIKTLPQHLKPLGYISFQSGKWWEGSYQRGGFDEGMTKGFPHPKGRHGDDGLKIGREGMAPVTDFIDRAIAKQKPFFVWYAPFLPHTPHTPPKRLFDKYSSKGLPKGLANYYAMVEWFDETNATLLNHLEKKGVRQNTLVVYVTDNGWINDRDLATFLPRSKQSPGEGGVRTPIIYSWPGKLPAQDRAELTSSIDIVPTILDAVGLPVPSELPGISLFENMKNKTTIARDTIYGEGFAHDIADVDQPEESLLYRWVIEGPWKLILSYDGQGDHYAARHTMHAGPQLYHLATDPHEKQNLLKAYPDVAKRLTQKIADWYPLKQRKVIK